MSQQLIDPSWFQLAFAAGLVLVAIGLSAAHGLGLDPGATVVLVAGAFYFVSLILGRRGIIFHRLQPARHRTA